MASAGCWGCPATPAGGRPVGGPVASPGRDGQLPPILRTHGRQCCGGVRLCSHPPWPGCGPRVDQVSPPLRAPGPRAAPRPRAISAGRSVHAHATTVLGRPQQEACRVRAGVQAALAAADTARPPQSCLGGRRPTQLGSRASGSTVERGGHRHPQGHGAGAPRLVSSSMGCSHRRPVPAGAASDADPPRGSRAQPGGMQEEVVHRGVLSLHVMQWGPRAP